jgi:hypothetical protein
MKTASRCASRHAALFQKIAHYYCYPLAFAHFICLENLEEVTVGYCAPLCALLLSSLPFGVL